MSSFQVCNGFFMFQGIIMFGDVSGLIFVEIIYINGVGVQIKKVIDFCLFGLK